MFDEYLGLERPGAALIALLLLRGPQTAAELQARSGRMADFISTNDAEAALHSLAQRELVRLMDRLPGQSAARWQQLVADEAEMVVRAPTPGAGARHVADEPGLAVRVAELEERVARLESALADLL